MLDAQVATVRVRLPLTGVSDLKLRDWNNWIMAVLGGWLVVSPLALQQETPSGAWTPLTIWNFTIIGALALLVAVAALVERAEWHGWLGLALGAWLTASPWIIGFADTVPAWTNAVLSGAGLASLSGWALWRKDAA